jgi:phosphoribosyl-AMP cyclohydrolase
LVSAQWRIGTGIIPIRVRGRVGKLPTSRNPPPASSRRAFLFSAKTMNLDFTKLDGLVPAIIQDVETNRVLMVGFMNEEAWQKTLETGFATFYSRTRNKLWMKGETSGHRLEVKEIRTDCDQDSVVLKVVAHGPGVCHEGYESCFFRQWRNGEWAIVDSKVYDEASVYGGKQ